jgi:hypothetical protein
MTQAYTHNFTEVHRPGGQLFPALRGIGVYNTVWLRMNNHQRAVFLLDVGAMGAFSTLDMTIQQATNTAGAGAKAIAGKAITQLTQVGGDENEQIVIELRTAELDVDGGFDTIRAQVTVAGAQVLFSLKPLRGCSNQPPVPVGLWTEIVL